tara:strand:- start:184 stop:366 length:183 start_codon:yes stop_codon:yes gene_type:complete
MFESVIDSLTSILVVFCLMMISLYAGFIVGLRKKVDLMTDGYISGLEKENKRLRSEQRKG